ncbi:MAG: hypothetical protein JKY94_08880 [Rhodobacteraceae bacterium]|nr:hypothetical protein [Paracoccaceae bacterium]
MDLDKQIYSGGFYSIVKSFERKQIPFKNAASVLPPPDVDLAQLWDITVQAPDAPAPADWRFDVRNKHLQLKHIFAGENELFLLHAMLIAILRRDDPPPVASDLFFRIWREQGSRMARTLSTRWLISAATTFADCGKTMEQRAAGMGLSMLFDLIKLHDSERRLTGQKGNRPFRQARGTTRQPLAFDMRPYSLARGDLDRNMLARLWKLCETDNTVRPLGSRMLEMVMTDERSIFARVQHFRPKNEDKPVETDS